MDLGGLSRILVGASAASLLTIGLAPAAAADDMSPAQQNASVLRTPLPAKSLSITALFQGESVVSPVETLDRHRWQELARCFPNAR